MSNNIKPIADMSYGALADIDKIIERHNALIRDFDDICTRMQQLKARINNLYLSPILISLDPESDKKVKEKVKKFKK
jgi:hypothetical protein